MYYRQWCSCFYTFFSINNSDAISATQYGRKNTVSPDTWLVCETFVCNSHWQSGGGEGSFNMKAVYPLWFWSALECFRIRSLISNVKHDN